MRLVERHSINENHKYYDELDKLSFKSKNLYNHANYLIRQDYFEKLKNNSISSTSNYLKYFDLFHIIKSSKDYKELPAKVSNSILQILDKNWKSFIKSRNDYYLEPNKYLGKPKMPKYKHKEDGRNILIYDKQALNKKHLKEGFIKLSLTKIKISTRIDFDLIKQIRVIPSLNEYIIEIVYEKEVKEKTIDKSNILAIDLGVNNLCTITTNIKKQSPIIINGRPLKSINQYYNKEKAKLQSFIGEKKTSKRIRKLTSKRNNKVSDYMHKTSKIVIDFCKTNKIGQIVIGKNKEWKQDVNIGSKNNQNFVGIPFNTLISKIKYKAELENIKLDVIEESYTSKCSFVDNEAICKHETYQGKRIKRGMFKTSSGMLINSDVNGSFNILKKYTTKRKEVEEYKYSIEGIAVSPFKILKIS